MLDLGGNNMVSPLAMGYGDPFYGKVIGFGAAAGKYYLIGVAAQKLGQHLAGLLHRSLRLNPIPVGTGGIAKMFP